MEPVAARCIILSVCGVSSASSLIRIWIVFLLGLNMSRMNGVAFVPELLIYSI